jgi:hypothetical protein
MILGVVLQGDRAENTDDPRMCALSELATRRRSVALVREFARQAMEALIRGSRPAPCCVGTDDLVGWNRSNA